MVLGLVAILLVVGLLYGPRAAVDRLVGPPPERTGDVERSTSSGGQAPLYQTERVENDGSQSGVRRGAEASGAGDATGTAEQEVPPSPNGTSSAGATPAPLSKEQLELLVEAIDGLRYYDQSGKLQKLAIELSEVRLTTSQAQSLLPAFDSYHRDDAVKIIYRRLSDPEKIEELLANFGTSDRRRLRQDLDLSEEPERGR